MEDFTAMFKINDPNTRRSWLKTVMQSSKAVPLPHPDNMDNIEQFLRKSNSYPELRNADGEYLTSNMCEDCQEGFLWARSWVPTTIGDNTERKIFAPDPLFSTDCPGCVFKLHSYVYATWTKPRPESINLRCKRSVVGLFTFYPSTTGGNLVVVITPPIDPDPGLIYGRRLRDTVDFLLLKSWVLRCFDNHRTCGLIKRPSLTNYFRVIDC